MESAMATTDGRPEAVPYPGPVPFETARDFHCRDEHVRRILNRMDTCRTVVVAGPAGCGKSSVVLAGVLPSVERRVSRTILFRPVPGSSLRETMGQVLSSALPDLPPGTTDSLFPDGSGPDPETVRRTAEILARDAGTVLVVDQFEELVDRCPREAGELLDLLVELTHAVHGARPGGPAPVRFLVTMRASCLDDLIVPRTAGDLERGVVLVAPLSTEQLRTALERPAVERAVRVDGALLDRLLADSEGHPRRMSLLQFALRRLWKTRDPLKGLTTACYDRLGNLLQAPERHRERVASGWSARERRRVEDLVLELSRPGPSGAPGPLRIDTLPTDLRPAVALTVEAGLAVVRRDPGRPEVLAPLLGLGTAPATAPGGPAPRRAGPPPRSPVPAPPATAAPCGPAVPQATGPGRDAATAGPCPQGPAGLAREAHGQGKEPAAAAGRMPGRHRPSPVTAALGALVLVLSCAVGAGWTALRAAEQDLSEQAGTLMARRSLEQAGLDEGYALRLALAAWDRAPGSDEAYAALLAARLRLADAKQVARPLPESIAGTDASASGDVFVTSDPDGTVRVRTGTEGDGAQPWQVGTFPDLWRVRLSDDGRFLVVARRSGLVQVWDVRARSAPRQLRPGSSQGTEPALSGLQIAPDGSVLGLVAARAGNRSTGGVLELWDVATGRRRAGTVPLGSGTAELLGVSEGGSLVTLAQGPVSARRLVVRDTRTGASVRQVGGAVAVLSGSTAASCADGGTGGTLTLRRLWRGTGTVRVSLPACPPSLEDLPERDSTGRFLIVRPEGSTTERLLVDLEDGGLWRYAAPPERTGTTPTAPGRSDRFLVTREGRGGPEVVQFAPGALLRHGTRPAWSPATLDGVQARAVSPDGTLVAVSGRTLPDTATSGGRGATKHASGFRLSVLDTAGGTSSARTAVAGLRGRPSLAPLLFSRDSSRLVAAGPDGPVVLPVDDLSERTELEAPAPLEGFEKETGLTASTAVLDAGGRLVVLRGGLLTRWDLATGERVASPVPVVSGRSAADLAGATLLARPGRPDQVLLLVGDAVEVWDLSRGSRIARQRPDPGERIAGSANGAAAVAVDGDGSVMAVSYRARTGIDLWDLDAGRSAGQQVAVPEGARPTGFAREGLLAVAAGGNRKAPSLSLWSTRTGQRVWTVSATGSSDGVGWRPTGRTWTSLPVHGLVAIDLSTPGRWATDLCRITDSAFTGQERRLLPEGAGGKDACG